MCVAESRSLLRTQSINMAGVSSAVVAPQRGQRTSIPTSRCFIGRALIVPATAIFTMRLLHALTALLLPLSAFAARKPTGDRFAEYHSKALSSPSLKLDDALYSKLTAAPRDYAVAILLTALDPRFGCQLCREFQPEWDLLAKSWVKGDKAGESRLLYGTLDFLDGKGTFQAVCKHFRRAASKDGTLADRRRSSYNCKPRPSSCSSTRPPALTQKPTLSPRGSTSPWGAYPPAYPTPTRFPRTPELTHPCSPQSADQIHAWLSRQLPSGPHPRISRPINYVRIVSITTALLGLVTFFAVAAPYALPVLQNRNLWAAGSLIAILLFTSGHMFNHIRKVPYVSGDGKGGISYFAPGFQNQFGLETQIIAAICESRSLLCLPAFSFVSSWGAEADCSLVQTVSWRSRLSRSRSRSHASPIRRRSRSPCLRGRACSSWRIATCSASSG